MATVYRKTYTKPLPSNAEQFSRKGERFARWKDGKGKTRTARVTTGKDGSERIILEAKRFLAKFRDGGGVVREVPTGCRDETAARAVLADLEKRAELVKAKVMTAEQDSIAEHQSTPLAEHFDAYRDYLRVHINRKTGFPATAAHRRNRLAHLERVAADCGWQKLTDLKRAKFETWLADREIDGMGARTRNTYAVSLSAFANWCVEAHRLPVNPFARLAQANERADPRRQRRALTAGELVRLLAVSRRRPLADAMTIRWGSRKGEAVAKIGDARRQYLESLGRKRALIYKTLVLTGLRYSELRSLTVGQMHLEGPRPYAVLKAADEKSRRGSEIPLRTDLVVDIGRHLVERLATAQKAASRGKLPIPAQLPADQPLFDMPQAMIAVLDRDLVAAGIARRTEDGRIDKRDERGRSFDVHAFRTTFNSLLAAAGVPLTTRRILMRHAAESVTDEHYADAKLIDLWAALANLPSLPLDGTNEPASHRATGTSDASSWLAPMLAPNLDNSGASVANVDKTTVSGRVGSSTVSVAKTPGNKGVSSVDNCGQQSGRADSNRRRPAWESRRRRP